MNLITGLLRSMRFRSWTKNLFVFAGILFSRRWSDSHALAMTALGALGFCLLSSSVYLINDIADRGRDRFHPDKSSRPIASGVLPPGSAAVFAILLAAAVLTASWLLVSEYALVVSVYFVMQLAYSFRLKHVVILDVLIIAMGFVLRALAGVSMVRDAGYQDTIISPWLMLCTFFLAVFLAFAKRRFEIVSLGDNAAGHRKILQEYSAALLDEMMGIASAACLIGYSIYTVSDRTLEQVSTRLWVTIPFVAYGIFRYLYLIHIKGHGGSPDRILLTDMPLLLNILLWLLTAVLSLALFPGSALGVA
jgi:4-hydroxybenzoate polyprenyltransferase